MNLAYKSNILFLTFRTGRDRMVALLKNRTMHIWTKAYKEGMPGGNPYVR